MVYGGEWQSGSNAITLARFWKVHCNPPHRWYSVRPALTIHYHGYQELHVAQVLLPGWWHEPLPSFVVLGSQILQCIDDSSASLLSVTFFPPVRAGTQVAQLYSPSGIFVRRPDWSRIGQNIVVDRAAHAVQTQTRVTESSYKNDDGSTCACIATKRRRKN